MTVVVVVVGKLLSFLHFRKHCRGILRYVKLRASEQSQKSEVPYTESELLTQKLRLGPKREK